MFKKPLSNIQTLAPLRTSDRRKLRQRVVQTYGVSPELGDLLVPDGLMSRKVATYTQVPGVVYLSSEGDPLWFTIGKGANNLIPTVYTLWKKYDLLPQSSTPAAVMSVLVGGADLMIPGVIQMSSPVPPRQLVSVVQRTAGSASTRRPPLVVGRLAMNLDTLKAAKKKKMALHVLHTWKDHLFDMGNKADPPGKMKAEEGEGRNEDAPKSEPVGAGERQESVPDDVATVPNRTNGAVSNALPPGKSLVPTSVPEFLAFSKEEVSDILRVVVLQAIKTTLASLTYASFPIPASTFYSSYILPFRPVFVHESSVDGEPSTEGSSSYPQIDIKHSSHKSLLAFFKFLVKQGILLVKCNKPEPLVMSVVATHPDVVAHQPYTSLRDVRVKEEKKKKREEYKVREIEVNEWRKPHAASGSVEFFTEGGFDSSALYSYSDLKSAVNKYVDARQLTNPRDRSYVNVWTDKVLLSTVRAKGVAPKRVRPLKRQVIARRLSKKMQSWYEVQAGGKDPVVKEGQLKPISVAVKVRRGRKRSTSVTGFEPFFLEGEEMADRLRRLCACATSVSTVPGKASGLEVLVQGKQTKAVTQFLLSRGVPRKWIQSVRVKK